MKKVLALLFTISLVFSVAGQASAVPHIAYNLPDDTIGNQVWTGSLGLDFNVNQTIEVTALGVFDALYPNDDPRGSGEGLVGPLTVQIFDLSDTTSFLAQIVFPAGTLGTSAAFIFSDPISLILLPGSYSIVAFGFDGDDPNYNTTLDSVSVITDDGGGALSFVGYRWNNQPDIAFPDDNAVVSSDAVFGAGTLAYNVVPEPTTLLLLGLGLIGLAGLSRRKFLK